MKSSKKNSRVAQRIIKIRKEAGLTQDGFADKIGYSRPYLSKIEAGIVLPSRSLLKAITDNFSDLGFSIDWILAEDDRPPYESDGRFFKMFRGSRKAEIFAGDLGLSIDEYRKIEAGEIKAPFSTRKLAEMLSTAPVKNPWEHPKLLSVEGECCPIEASAFDHIKKLFMVAVGAMLDHHLAPMLYNQPKEAIDPKEKEARVENLSKKIIDIISEDIQNIAISLTFIRWMNLARKKDGKEQ